MKHLILYACLLPNIVLAQKEFPTVWEGKFTVDARAKNCTDDLGYLVGGDLTEVEVLDGATGKSLWVYNFKEKHGVKKCEDWSLHQETETVEVTIQPKDKDAAQQVINLDCRTGQVVSESQLPARSKEKKKGSSKTMRNRRINQTSCYDEASNTTIDLGYDDKTMISAKGGRDLNITVEASGANAWKANFIGRVVRHLNNDMLPANDGKVILNVSTGFGKVFVVYEGITCLDLATGKVLWSTTFDNVETGGMLKAVQEIGRSAMPLPATDGVYICDFTKGERAIKKLDPNTGAVIWQADKLKKDDIVSELLLDGGNLIAHFGGLIRVESYIPGMNGNPDVYKVEYKFEGSTSIRAYNSATGKPAWNTEAMELPDNFRKSECSMISGNGQVKACGEKNMYVFDAATGKLMQQSEYNAKTIGKAKWLYAYNGNYMIEGDEGIAYLKPDGSAIYATNTDKCLFTEMDGDAFIVWTGKKSDDVKEFIRFNPDNGAILGKMEDCYHPHFNTSGDRFVRFDGSNVALYRTN